MYLPVILLIFIYQHQADAVEYRLPKTVLPTHYEITLNFTDINNVSADRFKGEVNITLDVLNQTHEIQIHAKNLQNLTFDLMSNNQNFLLNNNDFNSNFTTHIVNITTKEMISPGRYYLLSSYEGFFHQNDTFGAYKSFYFNEGKIEYLVSTEMALTNARKVFPCFDEPDFKATFSLSIVPPEGYKVLANTDPKASNDSDVLNFKTTPLMSTYLVAFVISNYTCNMTQDGIIYRVCSRPNSENQRNYALDILQKSVKYLENFTNIPYNISGIGKIDLVALPQFSDSAMENWGLVTFQEEVLLYDENVSTNVTRQKVATLIIHELAHMWFGNLVTLKWWSDTFLNEGLATYFQYFAQVETDWELDTQFVIEQLHTAFSADSTVASFPLSTNVSSAEEIRARFDVISYNKGASVVRMIANAIGLENFQKGIQDYLEKNKFGNTVAEDFWASFQKFSNLPLDIVEITKNWTYHAGYPVINVRISGANIVINQERFLWNGTGTTKWYVPVTYTTSRDNKTEFRNTTTKMWLTPQNEEILDVQIKEKSDWVLFNNQQIGYYRVYYDDNLWSRIEKTLVKNPENICKISRAQIIDDLFNFAKSGKISYSQLLDRIYFLKNDTNYYPWFAAFNNFGQILLKITSPTKTKLENYIGDLMSSLYNSSFVGKTNDQISILRQIVAFSWACKIKNSDCVNNSQRMFLGNKEKNQINRNLMLPVFCTSLRHSDNVENDWSFLWNQFTKSNVDSEKETILLALGCAKNRTILKKYLEESVTERSVVQRQHALLAIYSVISGTPDGVNLTLEFLIKNYTNIQNYFRNDNTIQSLIKDLVKRFTEQSQIEQLGLLLKNERLTPKLTKYTKEIIEVAKDNLKMNKKLQSELSSYFEKKEKSGSFRPMVHIWCFILVVSAKYFLF